MPERKTICKYCGKIAGENHHCPGFDKARREKNAGQRDYYQKNKELLKPLMSKKWKRFRKNILNRDGNMCQRCYRKFGIINSEELQAHHIKSRLHYPELMYDKSNVITVCKSCNGNLGVSDKLDFDWDPPVIDHVNI